MHGQPLSLHYAFRNEPNRFPLGCTLYSLSAGYNVIALDGFCSYLVCDLNLWRNDL